MRNVKSLLLAGIGLLLAVILPVVSAIALNFDPAESPARMLRWSVPGLFVMAFARRFWRSAEAPMETIAQTPPGHKVCEFCGKAVPEKNGVVRRLSLTTPLPQAAFVCHACSLYRAKRALIILVMFFAALGVFAVIFGLLLQLNGVKR